MDSSQYLNKKLCCNSTQQVSIAGHKGGRGPIVPVVGTAPT